MRFKHAFLHHNMTTGKIEVNATIDVPGIGEINVRECLSDELRARVAKEAIEVVRQRLGMGQDSPVTDR